MSSAVEHRLSRKRRSDASEAVRPVVGRHDAVRVEAAAVDDAEPELRLRPASARTVQIGGQVSLNAALGSGRHGTAGTGLSGDRQRSPASRRITRQTRQGSRNPVRTDHRGDVRGRSVLRQAACGALRAGVCRGEQDHNAQEGPQSHGDHAQPNVSAVMVRNQASA